MGFRDNSSSKSCRPNNTQLDHTEFTLTKPAALTAVNYLETLLLIGQIHWTVTAPIGQFELNSRYLKLRLFLFQHLPEDLRGVLLYLWVLREKGREEKGNAKCTLRVQS